ncbi:lipocalin family protein [Hymenobacter latericus]|uniref:lipocalin family protein n=1 Tax=Hymenobacter sp. YIM 151858-1 TaxID=2987688 RepID=UPI002226936A|nr:lipocalin family protein [Hymenobacter sp. YIM 151858-1]UYZ59843.1 lipocalin family protein [Hymenobacter sp. YIM 151858-1]
MKKLPVYLSLALALTGLASCEKELEEVAQPTAKAEAQVQQTPQQLLAAGQWHMTDLATVSTPAGAKEAVTTSMFAHMKTTLRDNLTQFTTDGRYVLDEGATKANPQADQQKSGSYTLSEDAKTLTVKVGDSERTFAVEELSANTLRLKMTEGEGANATSYVSTFAH